MTAAAERLDTFESRLKAEDAFRRDCDAEDSAGRHRGPPCPFCGSSDLRKTLWQSDEGEFGAVECNQCLAGAPAVVWDARADDGRRDFLSQALNEGDGIYRP